MKALHEIKTILREQKPYLAEQYGVTDISLFGSYVRNQQRPDSDIDILIALEDPPYIDLLDLVNMERYLAEILSMDVDITIKSNLRKRIGRRILRESVPI